MMLLIPADVLPPRRPDAHFEAEAVAARDAGLIVAVIDHDAFVRGGGPDRGGGEGPGRRRRDLPGCAPTDALIAALNTDNG